VWLLKFWGKVIAATWWWYWGVEAVGRWCCPKDSPGQVYGSATDALEWDPTAAAPRRGFLCLGRGGEGDLRLGYTRPRKERKAENKGKYSVKDSEPPPIPETEHQLSYRASRAIHSPSTNRAQDKLIFSQPASSVRRSDETGLSKGSEDDFYVDPRPRQPHLQLASVFRAPLRRDWLL
jgi:hypothetical protein